jgi:anti-sigma-K factor RskA
VDLSCIISSGDLELYVLGMLPEEEAHKITQLISIFPEIRDEVNSITESLAGIAAMGSNQPSDVVKEKLFQQFSELKAKENPSAVLFAEKESGQEKKVSLRAIPATKKYNWLMAAAIIGLFITTGMVIFLALQNSRHERELVALREATDRANKGLVEQQKENLAYNEMLQLLQDENYSRINLSNVAGKPVATVKLFWNRKTNELVIGSSNLPRPPAGRQYQLWAIVDGKPVNAGMLQEKTVSLQKMLPFQKADAFAITLEKAGGSEQPTLEEMYVMGKPS